MSSRFIDELYLIVCQQPDAMAVVDEENVTLSYLQLWRNATVLGLQLQQQGIGQGKVCAIDCQQSSPFIVALIATWWVDAAVVPIDQRIPEVRRQEILKNCSVDVVINESQVIINTSETIDPLLPPLPGVLSSLAYIICSSGSSGRAKYIELLHTGLVPVLHDQINAFRISKQSRVLWALAPGFDASFSDIGTALLAGASLIICQTRILADLIHLLDILKKQGVTHADLPPSLLPHLDIQMLPDCLTCLIVGGEVANPNAIRQLAVNRRIISVYGPSEATICTSLAVCNSQWEEPLLGQTIGGAIYHVDSATGELWIGGPVLARGYKDKAMTTARFVTDTTGQRWFKTGDSVRYNKEGDLIFCGRTDRQFKHYGQLIAPEEIENVLRKHPQVIDAAVINKASQIFAFVEGENDNLSKWCQHFLPPWLCPDRFIQLDSLPRLPNGKCHFTQLYKYTLQQEKGCQLKGEREHQLANAWRRVFPNLTAIFRENNFFTDGGNSFTVIELISEAESEGLLLSVEVITQYRNLAAIAAVADQDNRLDTPFLRQDVEKLLKTLAPKKQSLLNTSKHLILVTGATGFLGIHLLEALQNRGIMQLAVLIRGRDESHIKQRLKQQAQQYKCALDFSSIRYLCGDLELINLGLQRKDEDFLSKNLLAIFHCAGKVSLAESYSSLKASNVLAVYHLINFVNRYGIEYFDYASTLSVQVASDQSTGLLSETDSLAETNWVHGGYAQSKWAADYLLQSAMPNARIYRLGLLTAHSTRLCLPTNDWLSDMVRGFTVLGCAPKSAALYTFDCTPVNYAAQAIVACFEARGTSCYIVSGRSVSLTELVSAIKATEVKISWVNDETWLKKLRQANIHPWLRAALRLGCVRCEGEDAYRHYMSLDLFQTSNNSFDDQRMQEIIKQQQVPIPQINSALLKTYVAQMLKING